MATQVSTDVQLPEYMRAFEQRVGMLGIAGVERLVSTG